MLALFLTWFNTTQPLLKPINVKFALSRLILSRHHNKSSRWLLVDEDDGAVEVVLEGGGVWRSPWSKSGVVKSEAIGIVLLGSELHSSLHEKSESVVEESWTCKMSMCISVSSGSVFEATINYHDKFLKFNKFEIYTHMYLWEFLTVRFRALTSVS